MGRLRLRLWGAARSRPASSAGEGANTNILLSIPCAAEVVAGMEESGFFAAELIWRRGTDLGVRLRPIDITRPPTPQIHILWRIWAGTAGRGPDFREAVR